MHLAHLGCIAILAAIAPAREDIDRARTSGTDCLYEVYVSTQQAVCEARNSKGHYAKACGGHIRGFTGVTSAYEAPLNPEVSIDCGTTRVAQAVAIVRAMLIAGGTIHVSTATDQRTDDL